MGGGRPARPEFLNPGAIGVDAVAFSLLCGRHASSSDIFGFCWETRSAREALPLLEKGYVIYGYGSFGGISRPGDSFVEKSNAHR